MKNFRILKNLFFFLIVCLIFSVSITGCGNEKEKEKTTATDSIAAPSGRFFTLSDLHFNPYYDSSLVMKLAQTDVQNWEAIFQSSQVKNYGVYGQDSYF